MFGWEDVKMLVYLVGKPKHPNNIESSYPWSGISLHLFRSYIYSSGFKNFPHIDLIFILLDLFLSTSFFGANVNSILFLISNFTCSLLK